VNAPARRRVLPSLRLKPSLRDRAAVPDTKRDADAVRQDAPGSLELESSILFPRVVKSRALKPGEIHSPAQQSHYSRSLQAHRRVKIDKSRLSTLCFHPWSQDSGSAMESWRRVT